MSPGADVPLSNDLSISTTEGQRDGVLREDEPLRTYAARWGVLVIYMLLGLTNQACWLTFSAVSKGAAARYEVTQDWITAQTTTVTLMFLPGSWIVSRALAGQDGSLRRAVLIGAAFQASGAVVRWIGDVLVRPLNLRLAFAVVTLGQDLCALASPAFINTPATLAEDWFSIGEREPVLSAAIFSPIVGQGVGSASSGFVAGGKHAEGLGKIITWQAIASVLLFILTWLFFRSKPPTPPVRTKHETPMETKVFVTWVRILRRPQYLLLLTIFDVGTAIGAGVLTLFSQFSGACGYTPGIAGLASGVYILGGMVGALVSGSALGRTRAYRTCLRCTVLGALIAGTGWTASLKPNAAGWLLVAMGAFGGCLMGCLPALITNAVEETYPIPADACTSLLFLSANILQVAVTPAWQAVHNIEVNKCGGIFAPSRLFVIGLAVFGCFLPMVSYRGECHRKLAEERMLQEARNLVQIS